MEKAHLYVLPPLLNKMVGSPEFLGSNAELLAPVVGKMAQTGIGTDLCLEHKCLPVPVHFYSPIPDLKDLEERGLWEKRSAMEGLDFRAEDQVALMGELGAKYGAECDWTPDPTPDPFRFYTENNSFCFGCAASTHLMVRHFKPRRLIEIGSGFSSLVMSAAMLKNQEETGKKADYVIIDPYPGELVDKGLPAVTKLEKQRVELVPADFFDQLGENDILFIDSGHTVRTGSDINFLILDVLPRLAPGVVIHLHDIPMPWEYNRNLFTTPSFRWFWTESYLLQAFLCLNPSFEILMAVSYLMFERAEEFKQAFPHYDPDKHKNISGSFWIRRKA